MREGAYRAALQVEGSPATLLAKCVIIASGADYRQIEAEGRDDFDGSLETSCLGIFAAGDVRSGSVKRCAAERVSVIEPTFVPRYTAVHQDL